MNKEKAKEAFDSGLYALALTWLDGSTDEFEKEFGKKIYRRSYSVDVNRMSSKEFDKIIIDGSNRATERKLNPLTPDQILEVANRIVATFDKGENK